MTPSVLSSRVITILGRGQSRISRSVWVCNSCRQQASRRLNHATSYRSPDVPENRPVYITTPIFYVNADPHVGHMYTMIIADVLKRWHQLSGKKTILLTGTDEHGMKIQQASAAAKMDPKSFCDKGALVFKELAEKTDISYDTFIRTTDEAHKEAVQYAWYLLKERGLLYEAKHEGWYSVSDETFYPQDEIHTVLDPTTGHTTMNSKETGKEVTWISEINWKFRLSAFREPLLQYYKDHPNWIVPRTRMEEIIRGVEIGSDIQDLSVSRPRSRLHWGVPVPGDPEQTIYVWLDALLNYITGAGYPWTPGQEYVKGWPAKCQIIGKDIMRFHCIYWPAFLMALDIPLPEQFLAHGHWLLGQEKMAKSTGNVVNPFFALDRFGSDTMRFYLSYYGNLSKDSSYSNDTITTAYTTLLQNRIGNLTSRITKTKWFSLRRSVCNRKQFNKTSESIDLANRVRGAVIRTHRAMKALEFSEALKAIMEITLLANAHFANSAPWVLAKKMSEEQNNAGENKAMDAIIYESAEAMRIAAILLQPFMPGKAKDILDLWGVADDRRMLKHCGYGKDDSYGTSRWQPKDTTKEGYMIFPPLIITS